MHVFFYVRFLRKNLRYMLRKFYGITFFVMALFTHATNLVEFRDKTELKAYIPFKNIVFNKGSMIVVIATAILTIKRGCRKR